MVGHYKLGHEQIALLLAATLFESLINSHLEGWDEENINNTKLEDKINEIQIPQKQRLHDFRKLRNKIVHGRIDEILSEQRDTIEDFIVFLWSHLAPDSFEKADSKHQMGQSIFATLYEHSADYMVRGLSEVEFLDRDEKAAKYKDKDSQNDRIEPGDFENLFTLREKLVFLKYYISKWLDENKISLKTDILTIIDTTSGYIWMPLVPKNPAAGERASVYECSVSLLATPFDFRIYMDFGGYQREKRKLYYKFLSDSPEYEEVKNRLTNKQCLKVFDIDWYFSKSNERSFSEWLLSKDDDLVKAKEKIDSAKKPESSPITWNRCLHGYVFSKKDLGDGYIDFSRMENKLRDIIEFYRAFIKFIQRVAEETA
jgi:hypothetical protein